MIDGGQAATVFRASTLGMMLKVATGFRKDVMLSILSSDHRHGLDRTDPGSS
jgi:hypothetical protein